MTIRFESEVAAGVAGPSFDPVGVVAWFDTVRGVPGMVGVTIEYALARRDRFCALFFSFSSFHPYHVTQTTSLLGWSCCEKGIDKDDLCTI